MLVGVIEQPTLEDSFENSTLVKVIIAFRKMI
jgi:hypothetical protein